MSMCFHELTNCSCIAWSVTAVYILQIGARSVVTRSPGVAEKGYVGLDPDHEYLQLVHPSPACQWRSGGEVCMNTWVLRMHLMIYHNIRLWLNTCALIVEVPNYGEVIYLAVEKLLM